jgi:hypothetical protein
MPRVVTVLLLTASAVAAIWPSGLILCVHAADGVVRFETAEGGCCCDEAHDAEGAGTPCEGCTDHSLCDLFSKPGRPPLPQVAAHATAGSTPAAAYAARRPARARSRTAGEPTARHPAQREGVLLRI